jgi:hypothetical protein
VRQLVNYFEASAGDCARVVEPCPRLDCRYHVHGDARPCQVEAAPFPTTTCSLKIAERGGLTLEAVGEILGLTRERVRQIESNGREKLRRRLSKMGYDTSDLLSSGGSPSPSSGGKFS